jgi:hypothetical protein
VIISLRDDHERRFLRFNFNIHSLVSEF